ncbi:hypothetical protein ACF08M_23070 [Streptomyces sp. NPDC015032]|uniref:hypothetical protein n=1 Tax=Streptomyces sp. NPDC015032 TaxID=3364937 RepID=UPI0036F90E40
MNYVPVAAKERRPHTPWMVRAASMDAGHSLAPSALEVPVTMADAPVSAVRPPVPQPHDCEDCEKELRTWRSGGGDKMRAEYEVSLAGK